VWRYTPAVLRLSDEEIERAALAAHLHQDGACWRVVADVLHLRGPGHACLLAEAFRRLCYRVRSAPGDKPDN